MSTERQRQPCAVHDCPAPALLRGLCQQHLARWREGTLDAGNGPPAGGDDENDSEEET
jgi:hypothetical protein